MQEPGENDGYSVGLTANALLSRPQVHHELSDSSIICRSSDKNLLRLVLNACPSTREGNTLFGHVLYNHLQNSTYQTQRKYTVGEDTTRSQRLEL